MSVSKSRKAQGAETAAEIISNRPGDGPMDLLRKAAEKDERLVAYFGSSETVGDIFDRFNRFHPDAGIRYIPDFLDASNGPEDYARRMGELAQFTFPGLPREVREDAFRFFVRECRKLTVEDFQEWYGQEMMDFVRRDGTSVKVPMVACPNVVFKQFEFNGKPCFVCECESMYKNAWVVDGRRINSFGPYGSPKLVCIGHYGEDGRAVVDHMVGIQRMDHAMSGLPSSEPVAMEMFSDQGDIIRSGFVVLDTVPADDNEHRSSAGVSLKYPDGREEFLTVGTVLRMEREAAQRRMDDIRSRSVASYLDASGGIDRPFDEAPYYDAIHRAYGQASPTREVIGGNFANDFAGEAHWSRALDFKVPGWDEFKGLRYIDFKDCTNVHVLMKDGNSVPIRDIGQKRLTDVKFSMDRFLKQSKHRQVKKNQISF